MFALASNHLRSALRSSPLSNPGRVIPFRGNTVATDTFEDDWKDDRIEALEYELHRKNRQLETTYTVIGVSVAAATLTLIIRHFTKRNEKSPPESP